MRGDIVYMSRCLKLAQKGVGATSPNPMVGAVIVKNGKILAEGYHRRAGLPHAEIEALKKLKFKAPGATLYVNLEPCFHHGRTPPCVHPIINSGISRIVIAHRDPNPLVGGKSIRFLKKSGIVVKEGVLEKEARFLNRFFLTWVTMKRPYVILKAGVSLDGKIAPGLNLLLGKIPPNPPLLKGGECESPPLKKGGQGGFTHTWITCPQSRRRVHQLRSQVDAILVGVNTIIADNPRLNVRGIRNAKQPLRIILDTHLQTPVRSEIFKTRGGRVILSTTVSSRQRAKKYERMTARVIRFSEDRHSFVPVGPLLHQLAKEEVTSLLVEGGARVFASFLQSGMVDEIIFFIAPKLLGPQAVDILPPKSSQMNKFPYRIQSVTPSGVDLEVHLAAG